MTPLAGLTPTAGTPTPSPAIGATPIVNVTAVTPFEITVNEAVNIRQAPSASATILGIIAPGEKKNVVGEALGEEAAAGSGNRTWYALDGGGFVYSGLVEKVEGGGQ